MKKFSAKFRKTTQLFLLPLLIVSYFSACNGDDPLPPKSSEKVMSEFNISAGGATFSAELQSDGKTFHFLVPLDFNEDYLKTATPTFKLSAGATASPASGQSQDFTKDVNYTVTAEDESSTVYTVHKVDMPSSEAAFRSFSLKIGVGKDATCVIDDPNSTVWIPRAEIDDMEVLEEAIPTFTLSIGATASPATGVAQNFTEAVSYVITANDGTIRNWEVKLSNRSDADILFFYFDLWEGTQVAHQRGEIQIEADIDRETRAITYTLSALPSWFTPAKMTVFPSVIEISQGATVSPNWDVPQDFTKDVVYTVTAEDGVTQKQWTVKAPKYYMTEKWGVDYASLSDIVTDLGGQNPNSIAIVGNYLSISRAADLLNKSDGTLAGTKLNVTGWRAANNSTSTDPLVTQDFPFFITNDDAGNMVGSNLSAWNTDNFILYKWTSPSADPVEVMVFPTKKDGVQFSSFGRKWQILGDVNGKGLIIASNIMDASTLTAGEHYVWKINNGVVDVDNPTVVQTTIPMMNYGYQLLTPLGTDLEPPYYIGSSTVTVGESYVYVNLQLGTIGNVSEIKGPFDAVCQVNSANGWGNMHWFYHKLFSFDSKNMISTFSGSNGTFFYYCFAVLERNADNSHTPVATAAIPWNGTDWPNGNGTGTFTMEKVGNDIFFYVFPTNRGIFCYQLSKF